MILKKTAVVEGVQAQIWWALGVADQLHQVMFARELVVTALKDGQHNAGSKHPLGFAADIRTRGLSPADAARFFQLLKMKLDRLGFDIVPEGGNPGEIATPFTTGEHIHIEFDWHPGDRDFFLYCD